MPGGWAYSDRRARLPKDWKQRRSKVKWRARDRCEVVEDGQRCRRLGTQCDHIVPGDNHELDNLQWICEPHHSKKSSAEGHAARAAMPKMHRPPEEHPAFR